MSEQGRQKFFLGDSCYYVSLPSNACGYELYITRGVDKKTGKPHTEFLGHWGTMTGFLKGFERYVVKNNEMKGQTGRLTLEDLLKEQIKAIAYVKKIEKELGVKLNGR